MKVLLTGASGFIAAHCLDSLLDHGHEVVATVRSHQKGRALLNNHNDTTEEKLSYVVVEDIAREDAFNKAVVADPPFDAVVHTASPLHFNVTDVQREIIDPAVRGTTGILRAVKTNALSVKQVIITSSFAAMINPAGHPENYSEKHWNQVTPEEALKDPVAAYRASKTYAEKAAWEFMETENPHFQLTTICPPLVFGVTSNRTCSFSGVNASNSRFQDMIEGRWKDKVTPSTMFLWIDVQDLALAHTRSLENAEACGKRIFVVAGHMCNKDLVEAARAGCLDLASILPPKESPSDMPEDVYGYDDSRASSLLGLKFKPLDRCVIDTVRSVQAILSRSEA